jgi:NADPH2:quinone reductase
LKQVRVNGFGSVAQLELADAQEPEPRAGEVVLEVRACGLNYADLAQREGSYLGGPRPPFVPGVEAAGVIVACGAGVTRLARGDRVVAIGSGGLHAQRATVPSAWCRPLPGALGFVEGAAFGVSFLTAYHALVTVAHAERDEVVLIHAAGGAVGTAAVQLARTLGLRVVATASSAAKRERVRALGAECVVDYDGFESAARALSAGAGPAIVLASSGGDVLRRSLGLLAPLGRLVLFGLAGGAAAPIDPVKLLYRSQAVLGLHLDAILRRADLLERSLSRLLEQLAAGTLAVQVGHVLPLAEIRAAHTLLASRERYGKIVLEP